MKSSDSDILIMARGKPGKLVGEEVGGAENRRLVELCCEIALELRKMLITKIRDIKNKNVGPNRNTKNLLENHIVKVTLHAQRCWAQLLIVSMITPTKCKIAYKVV
jgi:hypothetical protein